MVFVSPFTIDDPRLPPHFFLGRPAKGFKGIHFLEQGLQAGVVAATIKLNVLFSREIGAIARQGITARGSSRFGRRQGISMAVFENVSELKKINVKKLMEKSFADSTQTAYSTAINVFNQNLKFTGPPLTQSGTRGPTIGAFRYEFFNTGKTTGIRVREVGDGLTISKMRALNFGLRRGS